MDKKIMIIAAIIVVVVAVFGVAYVIGDHDDDGHNVTYHGNGGTTIGDNEESIISSSSTTLESKFFDRTGYTQCDWNTQADGSGTTYLSGDKVPSGVSDLYALWFPNIEYKGIAVDSLIYPNTNFSVSVVGTVNGTQYSKQIGTQAGEYSKSFVATDTKVVIKIDGATNVKMFGDYAVFSLASYDVYVKYTGGGVTGTPVAGTDSVSIPITATGTVTAEVFLKTPVLTVTVPEVSEFTYKLVSVKDGAVVDSWDLDGCFIKTDVDYYELRVCPKDGEISAMTYGKSFTVQYSDSTTKSYSFSESLTNCTVSDNDNVTHQSYYGFTIYADDGIGCGFILTFS